MAATRRTWTAILVLSGAWALSGCGANVVQFEADPPPLAFDMLSDFEPANGLNFNPSDKWFGAWQVAHDGTPNGTVNEEIAELVPPRASFAGIESTRALHVTCNGEHAGWGAMWYAFSIEGRGLDAAGYAGIAFWARADGSNQRVSLAIDELESFPSPVNEHRMCDSASGMGGQGCSDANRASIYPDDVWRRYELQFSALGGWGRASFDASRHYAIKFFARPGVSYSVWIDDIAFYAR
jgi:hypothetical protein